MKWPRWMLFGSALVLIAPIVMVPSVLEEDGTFHDERLFRPRTVGPWTVTLVEHLQGPPLTTRAGRRMKDFGAIFCDACRKGIRAAYLYAGARPQIGQPGMPLHGNPYRLHAHVEFPAHGTAADSLWLTVDAWDGSVHQVSWAIANSIIVDGGTVKH